MSLLNMFNRMLARSDLFDRMVDTLGVREAMADKNDHGNLTRRAVSRCMGCKDGEACSHWLEANETAAAAPGFCRNHDMFARLKHEIEAAT